MYGISVYSVVLYCLGLVHSVGLSPILTVYPKDAEMEAGPIMSVLHSPSASTPLDLRRPYLTRITLPFLGGYRCPLLGGVDSGQLLLSRFTNRK